MTAEQTSIEQLTSGSQAASQPRAGFGDDAVIACDSLVRIYSTAGIEVQALQGLDLDAGRGVDPDQAVAGDDRGVPGAVARRRGGPVAAGELLNGGPLRHCLASLAGASLASGGVSVPAADQGSLISTSPAFIQS